MTITGRRIGLSGTWNRTKLSGRCQGESVGPVEAGSRVAAATDNAGVPTAKVDYILLFRRAATTLTLPTSEQIESPPTQTKLTPLQRPVPSRALARDHHAWSIA